MSPVIFDQISFFYNIIEKNILKDYQGTHDILNKHVTIASSDEIADVGGGTGFFSNLYEPNIHQITLIEPSRKMLLKNQNSNVRKIQAFAQNLPIKDQTFTKTFLINTLHHIPATSHETIIQDIYRTLKPKAQLIIIEVRKPKSWTHKLFIKIEQILTGPTYHIQPKTMKKYLNNAGFHSITTIIPPDHNWKYLIIAEK